VGGDPGGRRQSHRPAIFLRVPAERKAGARGAAVSPVALPPVAGGTKSPGKGG
jgi:hypothetical protein